jgi:hypothetical protein
LDETSATFPLLFPLVEELTEADLDAPYFALGAAFLRIASFFLEIGRLWLLLFALPRFAVSAIFKGVFCPDRIQFLSGCSSQSECLPNSIGGTFVPHETLNQTRLRASQKN